MSPTAPRRPCTRSPCPNLQPCPVHGKRPWQWGRASAHRRGYGERHRRWRALVLARDVTCRDPERRHPGVVVPATVADHRTPLPRPNWWDGDWSLENGQGLCESCHAVKSAREARGG